MLLIYDTHVNCCYSCEMISYPAFELIANLVSVSLTFAPVPVVALLVLACNSIQAGYSLA